MFGILYIATILATNVYLETGLAIFNLETGLSMFILKIVYQCLPGNWFSNVYLETNLEDGREAPSKARKKGAKRLEFLVNQK